MRRRAAALVAALAAVALALPPAAAQGGRSGRIALASQTPWVGEGGVFGIRLLVTDVRRPADVEVAVSVHRPVTSRSEFQRTLEGDVSTSVIPPGVSEPVERLPLDAAGARYVELGVQDPATNRDPTRVALRSPGVYPVRVELREAGGGAILDDLVTHLVYLPDPVDGPKLAVASIVPVHAPPALQPDGTHRLPDDASDRLGRLAGSLERHAPVPLTVAPTPETLQALAESDRPVDQETLARLARNTSGEGRQVLGGTYVPVALASMAGAMEDEATAQLARGNEIVANRLRTRPDRRTQIVQPPLTDAVLNRLRQQQVDRVVVAEESLAPVRLQVTLTQPFRIGGRQGQRVDGVVADPGLVRHFDGGDDAVLAAHHLLADLAVVYFDSPGRNRGVVAQPPRTWDPAPAFVDAFLSGLTTSPIVRGVTLDELFLVPPATAGNGRPLVRTPPPRPAPSPALPTSDIRTLRDRLDDFGTILEPGEPIFGRLEESLLVTQSVDLRPARRRAYVAGFERQLSDQLDRIRTPEDRSITLTARRGRIPVTVQSSVPYPVHVVVRVESDQLRFPRGATRRLALTRPNTVALFTVQARTSGAFPMRVRLESPDGNLLLSSSRFTVRSTAASGVGVILSIGAGWFLLVWWARHALARRRRRPAGTEKA